MDSEEREIFQFLKTWGVDFVSYKEIARRAGGKRKFHEDPEWAKPVMARLLERRVLESDAQGRFRLKPVTKHKATRWVSPDIAKILEDKGLKVEGTTSTEVATEEHYDGL